MKKIEIYTLEQYTEDMNPNIQRIADKCGVPPDDVRYALYVLGKDVVCAELERDRKEKVERDKKKMKIKSEGVIFGGTYKPRKNPFRHSYRAEYAEIGFLVCIFALFLFVLWLAGVVQ